MKAIVYREYGGPEVLKLEDVPTPVPTASEVLVRVKAAAVNPADWQIRSGKRTRLATPFQVIPGFDFAGIVEEPGASGIPRGTQVFGMAPLRLDVETMGSYAEFIAVPIQSIVPMPAGMSFEEAAALPVAVLTVWNSLFELGELSTGQSILIHAAAGGVGHIAVQMAKGAGAYVFGTASQGNLSFLKEIGVDRPIDYSAEKFEDIAKNVDMVLDGVINDATAQIDRAVVDTRMRSWQCLRPGGIMVSITSMLDETLANKFGVRIAKGFALPNQEALLHAAKLYEQSQLKPHVSKILPLETAEQAHILSEQGRTRGKVVLRVAD